MRHAEEGRLSSQLLKEFTDEVEERIKQGEHLQRKVEEIGKTLEELASSLNDVKQKVGTVEGRLHSVELSIQRLEEARISLKGELESRLKGLEKRVKSVEERVEELSSGLKAFAPVAGSNAVEAVYAALAVITRCIHDKSMFRPKVEDVKACMEELTRRQDTARLLYQAAGCPHRCCKPIEIELSDEVEETVPPSEMLTVKALTALLEEARMLPDALLVGKERPSLWRVAAALALLLCCTRGRESP